MEEHGAATDERFYISDIGYLGEVCGEGIDIQIIGRPTKRKYIV